MNLLKKCKFAPYKTVDEYTYIFFDSYKKQLIPMMRLLIKVEK
jgi:hypothetical protein